MDKSKDEISALLRQTTTKKNLFRSGLGPGMVYLTAAAENKSTPLGLYPGPYSLSEICVPNEQFDDAMIIEAISWCLWQTDFSSLNNSPLLTTTS